ncbi:MAG: phosphatidylinositol-specific phospholipase C domain-containing protein [Bacteroidota bacterium]
MKSLILFLLVLFAGILAAQQYVQLENRWMKDGKTHYQVHNQNGTPEAGAVNADWWSKDWVVEDAGGGYVRFKNRGKGTYLLQNAASGPVEIGPAEKGWWSAQWKLEPAGKYFRIKNRWKNTYLHIQNAGLEAGSIQPNWWSAQWELKGYSGKPTSAEGGALAPDEPIVDAAAPVTSWIYANRGLLGNRKLNRLVLPGTHDAGTHKLDNTWNRGVNDVFAPDTDDQKRGLSFLGEGYHKWAKAQEKSIYQQLNDGIRYIDIRVCVDKSDRLKTCHGLYGVPIQEVINDAVKFTNENPNEPFILDFKRFYDWSEKTRNGKEDVATYQGIRQSKLDELAGMLERTIGPRMAPTSLSPESTLNQLLATRRPIIVFWNKARSGNFQSTYLWDRGKMESIWKKGEIRRDKINFYANKLNALRNTTDFISMECQITPSNELYKGAYDFTGSFPFGLENVAAQTNPVVLSYIANEWKNARHNIIQVDFYNQTGLINLCKQLNGVAAPAPQKVAIADRNASTWGSWKLGAGSLFTTSEYEYRVEIDACHSDLDHTGTGNQITVQFWAGSQRVASKYVDGPGDQCSVFLKDTGFSIKTQEAITHVVVKTNGGDGYYIDQLKIYKGGELNAHHGRDDGKGWCLSTQASDANGDWKNYVANGCRSSQQFKLGVK